MSVENIMYKKKDLNFWTLKKIYKTNLCIKVRGNFLIIKRYSECLIAPIRTYKDWLLTAWSKSKSQHRKEKSEKYMNVKW